MELDLCMILYVSPIRANGNGARPMYDPLNCSDAEFAKINLNDILRM